MFGPKHPDTARSLHDLGTLMWAQGDLAAAHLLLERALEIREKVLGPEHPDTATSRDNLVSVECDPRTLLGQAKALRERYGLTGSGQSSRARKAHPRGRKGKPPTSKSR